VLAATAAALIAGQVTIGAAHAAQTVSVTPAARSGSASFPFGRATLWPPAMGFVYKDVPAFSLKPFDTIAFDLGMPNDVNIQLEIDMAATTVNGGDVPVAFTTVVPNTQVPANPVGNSVIGDYELQFTAVAPFNFAGGGLIIRFSNPGGAYAADTTNPFDSMFDVTNSSDTSGFFVKRFWGDADGLPPYTNSDTNVISGFRLTIQDLPPASEPAATSPATTATPKKKRCKHRKRHHSGAVIAKKCKKKRR